MTTIVSIHQLNGNPRFVDTSSVNYYQVGVLFSKSTSRVKFCRFTKIKRRFHIISESKDRQVAARSFLFE